MTALAEPWRTLGIAATNDARDVRRAYAKLLKAIDVEAEPERFIALREAFEHATALIGTVDTMDMAVPEAVAAPLDDERWSAPDVPDRDPARDTAPPDTVPSEPTQPDRADATSVHAEALERLLLSHPGDWMAASVEETDAMLGHWAAINADPRLEELGYYTQAEAWIAEIVARGCPFSDPLVPLVAERFGWIANAALLGQSPAVRYILDRHTTLVFLRDIARKGHPLHGAWKELTTVATEKSRRGWGTSRKSVAALLTLIRQDHPAAERYLDSWRVGLWENPQPRLAWSGLGIGLFLAFQVLRLFSAPTHDARQPVPPVNLVADALTNPQRDIDRVIKIVSHDHVDAMQMKESNPALYSDIVALWDKIKADGGNIWDLQAEIGVMTIARFQRVYSKAPYEQIKAYRQEMLAEALYYQGLGADACKDYLSGTRSQLQAVPDALVERRRNVVYDILLHTGKDRPNYTAGGQFRVSGDVMERAAKKAGLGREDFSAALNDKGSAQQQCDARIALSQIALSLPPKQGLKLLQDM